MTRRLNEWRMRYGRLAATGLASVLITWGVLAIGTASLLHTTLLRASTAGPACGIYGGPSKPPIPTGWYCTPYASDPETWETVEWQCCPPAEPCPTGMVQMSSGGPNCYVTGYDGPYETEVYCCPDCTSVNSEEECGGTYNPATSECCASVRACVIGVCTGGCATPGTCGVAPLTYPCCNGGCNPGTSGGVQNCIDCACTNRAGTGQPVSCQCR